ncbi:beta strand repeat-containing protein [Glaciecola siphonariae]|uniref:Beta strand repeat-containing protein n=1 Tax=Glaciecola siphonariae TaxID=521012 RepID=A0ABV9LSJ9_9ALTE
MKQVTRIFWLFSLTWLLMACGGGGSLERTQDGTPPTTPSNPTTEVVALSIGIFNAAGEAQSELDADTPLTVRVTATSDGSALAGAVITFSLSDPGLANFDNDTGTALTNAEGIAEISLTAGELSGSGTITATYSEDVSVSVGFNSSGAPDATALQLSLSASSTALSDAQPITLSATITDASGAPVSNQVVSFTLSQADLASFENDTGTALTGDDGVASIQLFVGTASGSGTVTATFGDVSETIGFESAGAPQQGAFSLDLFASTTQLASSGTDQIELIAVLKSQDNVLLADIPVSFSADQNASLTIVDSVSGEDGTARALLSTINNPENREVSVTATSGTLSASVVVRVVGTEVNLNGASSVILGDSAPITIVLSNSDGNGIANQQVSVTASNGSIDNETPVTNANGQVTVLYTATESGEDVITASALNATRSFPVTVQQDDFSFVSLNTAGVPLNTNEPIRLRWFKNGQPFANGNVTVTTSRGEVLGGNVSANVARTDANGIATVNITSQFAGPASISAVGTDVATNSQVSARANIDFIASEVASIFVDSTPDVIGPEGQTATITAVVRDSRGNLVTGKTVNFSILADATGGSISPNTAITDSNGIASTVFTSNAVSQFEGVTIEAESDGETGITQLTVGDRAFDISIGTGNAVESPDQSSYIKEFSVFVTDAAGRPIEGATLTASATPPVLNAYRKGQWVWDGDAQVYFTAGLEIPNTDPVEYSAPFSCNSEDANGNGRLDIVEDLNRNGELDPGEDANGDGVLDIGEDTNRDGQLTPGNVAVVSFRDGVAVTDANGQAYLEVRYAKQFGGWVSTSLTVFGQSAGTESSETQLYGLGAAASDLTEETNPPPANPFGVLPDCSLRN